MKKLLILSSLALLLAASAKAGLMEDVGLKSERVPIVTEQQSVNVDVTNTLGGIFEFLGNGSNFMFAAYGIASVDFDKFGGGVAVAYKVSDFVVPTVRLDYYDGNLWMPSGSLQLQVPLKFGSVKVVPFGFTGIATPVAGHLVASGTAIGIFGMGAAVQLSSRFDLVADYEKWTAGLGDQIRFGVLYKL